MGKTFFFFLIVANGTESNGRISDARTVEHQLLNGSMKYNLENVTSMLQKHVK